MKKAKDLEEDYILREEAVTKHKTEVERERADQKNHDEKLKALHYMKCSKCGHDLETKRMSYVDIDQCTNCGALVIEADKVDKFITEEKSILKSLLDFFK